MAGRSRIVINEDGITISTDGQVVYRASHHQFKQALEMGVNLQGLPSHDAYNEKFQLLSPSGEAMSNVAYKVSNAEQEFTALTDKEGHSKRITTESEQNLNVDLQWISLEKDHEGNTD